MRTVAAVVILGVVTVGAIDGRAEGGTRRGRAEGRSREELRREELLTIARQLKEAILKIDSATIVRYVGKDGIVCGDAMVSYGEVKQELEDPTSRFHAELFDSERLRQFVAGRTLGPPMSVKDYLEKARDLTTQVSFFEVKGKKRLDWAGITYTSSNFDLRTWPNVDLVRKKGRWILNSFFSGIGSSC